MDGLSRTRISAHNRGFWGRLAERNRWGLGALVVGVLGFAGCASSASDSPVAGTGAVVAGTGAVVGTGIAGSAVPVGVGTAGVGSVAGVGAAAGVGSVAGVGAAAGVGSVAGVGAVAGVGSVAGVGAAGVGSASAGGGAVAGIGAAGTGMAGGAATFTAVLGLFGPDVANCGICHASKAGSANGSLSFNTADKAGTYAALVGQASTGGPGSKCGGMQYVVAGKPMESLLYQKLAASPPCGARMPLGNTPLTDAQLATVSAWITAGAMND